MLTQKKILITGPASQVGIPICEVLAADNEVWGLARFSKPDDRAGVARDGASVDEMPVTEFEAAILLEPAAKAAHTRRRVPDEGFVTAG